MEERFDRAWVNFSWRRAVDTLVPERSRWHSSHGGLVRTDDALGDALAAALRDADKASPGNMELINLGWDLVKRLGDYEQESRLLVKLADTGRVIKILQQAVKTSLDVLNIHDAAIAESWRNELLRERMARLDKYEALVAEVLKSPSGSRQVCCRILSNLGLGSKMPRELASDVATEEQQIEILTLLKYGLQEHGDVLLPRELDVISAAYDWVVRHSGLVVGAIPPWFITTTYEWEYAVKTFPVDRREESCLRQAEIRAPLQHPHLQRFYGACHVGEPFIVVERCEQISSNESWKILFECALGLVYLHERRTVLRHKSASELRLVSCRGKGLLSAASLQRTPENASGQSAVLNDVYQFGLAVFLTLARARTSTENTLVRALPAVQPEFVLEKEWNLLCGMCSVELEDRMEMLEVVRVMEGLASAESSSHHEATQDVLPELIDDVESYVFPLAGQDIAEMLRDASELCREESEIMELNRLVYARLKDLYDQLVLAQTPLPAPLVGDFGSILWRFINRLEQAKSDDYSKTVSLCASRTIANRNYGLQHSIDHLLSTSPILQPSAPIHNWQSRWKELQQEQRAALQACQNNPQRYIDELTDENEISEASAMVQYETGWLSPSAVALPRWFIPPYQVEIEEHIADGSFGSAYRGRWLGADVVIKQVLTDQAKRENRDQFRQELDLWFSLDHPNLIKLYGACHEEKPFFVCERATGGTLTSFTMGKKRKTVWRSLWYAAWGLGYLHERGIVHGDLKGNNILMGKDAFTVKLADFGLSVLASNCSSAGEYAVSGAFRWKAPECLLGSPPTFASDIYSFGMCIIEAVTGEYPWGNSMGDDVVKYNVTEKRQLPRRPVAFLEVEWELVERMCCFDPDERIGALAVIQSTKRIQQWFSLGYLVEGGGDQSRRQERLSLQFG